MEQFIIDTLVNLAELSPVLAFFAIIVYLIVKQSTKDRDAFNERKRLETRAEASVLSSQSNVTDTVAKLSLQMNEQLADQQKLNLRLTEMQKEQEFEIKQLKAERDGLKARIDELEKENDDKDLLIAELKMKFDKLTTQILKAKNVPPAQTPDDNTNGNEEAA